MSRTPGHAKSAVGSWLLPVLLVAGAWLGFAFLHTGKLYRPSQAANTVEISSAEFLRGTSLVDLANADRDGIPTRLPDDWTLSQPEATDGWYRIEFTLTELPEPDPSLYLESVNARPELRLNGRRLSIGGGFARPMARSWHVPVFASVPDGALRLGGNELWIGIGVDAPGVGYLGRVHLGAEEDIRPAYEARHFFQVSLVQIITLSVALFSLLMATLFFLRRVESVYGWVAAVFAVWALGFVNVMVLDNRLPRPPGGWVGVVSVAWFAVLGTIFVNRLFGEVHWRVERVLLGIAAAGTVAWTVLHPPTEHPVLLAIWGTAFLLLGLYPGWLVVREHHRRRDLETQLMLTTGLLILTTAIHDVGMVNGLVPREHDSLIQFSAVAGVSVMAWIFLNRFIQALHTSEQLTAELEERVARKHAELEQGYLRLRSMERDRTLADERERITSEIHDGLGGQLVSTLAMTESGDVPLDEVSAALRGALDDLRLMIHSLDAADHDLLTVLGTLRARLEPRLARAGIEVRWRVVDLPDLPLLGPERVLHVSRILQEAVTNVLKHAEASHLTLRTGEASTEDDRPGVFVEVEDDGEGFAEARSTGVEGRGMTHMRRRAEAVGGRLEVSSGPSGTRVRIWLPVRAP